MLEFLFCRLLKLHVRPQWHDSRWQLYWVCERCGERQPGRTVRP